MAKNPNQIDFIEFPAGNPSAVAKAKAFYSATFGWSFQDLGDDYADTASSGLGCGFNADAEHRPEKPLVVIYASDLPAALAKVIASGAKITKDIFSFPGGRRFQFQDPCGNELAVWSDL
jgi:predicted enzyme related to lactoylglutathione lyase